MKILFHDNCNDGFCAAWLLNKVYPGAEFIPVQYNDGFDTTTLHGHDVIIADFSFPRDIMLRLHEHCASILCYDHHKTAQAELNGLDFCVFHMHKSGANLIWEAYREQIKLAAGEFKFKRMFDSMFKVVEYTEDRDLWRWNMMYSQEVNAAIASHPKTFEAWDSIAHNMWDFLYDGDPVPDTVREGKAILRYVNGIVGSKVSNHVFTADIGGYKVPCTNATTLISETCGAMAKGQPFAATFFLTENSVVFSLRSDGNNSDSVDVAEVAKGYGGGGHRHSAGFSVNMSIETFFEQLLDAPEVRWQ